MCHISLKGAFVKFHVIQKRKFMIIFPRPPLPPLKGNLQNIGKKKEKKKRDHNNYIEIQKFSFGLSSTSVVAMDNNNLIQMQGKL